MLLMQIIIAFGIIFSAASAQAGFIELGASGNYKNVNLADDVTDEQRSLTGSISYLFDEMSAIELSYTDGEQKTTVKTVVGTGPTAQETKQVTRLDYSLVGLDFILTLGTRETVLRPYLKLGAAYILQKRRTVVNSALGPLIEPQEEDPALVPSGGIGFRLLLSKQWSLKAGVDGWTSKSLSEDNVKIDYAGRAGLSWLF